MVVGRSACGRDRVLNRSARRVCPPDVLRLGEQVAVDHDAGSLGLFEGGPLVSVEIGCVGLPVATSVASTR
jgi:hypothetical protein